MLKVTTLCLLLMMCTEALAPGQSLESQPSESGALTLGKFEEKGGGLSSLLVKGGVAGIAMASGVIGSATGQAWHVKQTSQEPCPGWEDEGN